MEITILVFAAIAAIAWGIVKLHQKGVANFWNLLATTNEQHGTSFGTSPDHKATVIGSDTYKGGVLAFDQKNRKIAFLTKGGESIEILDYGFVRSWRVTWREKTGIGGAQFGIVAIGSANASQDKVFLEISTNDITRPIIRLPMSSLSWARDTAARLEIMVNAKI